VRRPRGPCGESQISRRETVRRSEHNYRASCREPASLESGGEPGPKDRRKRPPLCRKKPPPSPKTSMIAEGRMTTATVPLDQTIAFPEVGEHRARTIPSSSGRRRTPIQHPTESAECSEPPPAQPAARMKKRAAGIPVGGGNIYYGLDSLPATRHRLSPRPVGVQRPGCPSPFHIISAGPSDQPITIRSP